MSSATGGNDDGDWFVREGLGEVVFLCRVWVRARRFSRGGEKVKSKRMRYASKLVNLPDFT
jgi:hypothetical protein